jgi:hypothetical protein
MPDNKYQVNDINYYGTHVSKNPENLKSYSALFALTPYVGKATITKLQDSVMTEKMATMSANNLWSSNKNILETIRAVMNATVANNIVPVEPKQGDMTPNKKDVGEQQPLLSGLFASSVGDGVYTAPTKQSSIDGDIVAEKIKEERNKEMNRKAFPMEMETGEVSKTGEVIKREGTVPKMRPSIDELGLD